MSHVCCVHYNYSLKLTTKVMNIPSAAYFGILVLKNHSQLYFS